MRFLAVVLALGFGVASTGAMACGFKSLQANAEKPQVLAEQGKSNQTKIKLPESKS
ncbi:MAG: hypothetical protein ACFB6S_11445 [Geminicoccaceae bacterium]